MSLLVGVFFFFFQAEEGIRDADVTGVQTCALPILFCERRINAFACCSWADGTVCGTTLNEAGKKNDVAIPRKTCSATRCQTSARSSNNKQAIAPCATPLKTFVTTMTTLRGSRSAHTPPTRMKTICGA